MKIADKTFIGTYPKLSPDLLPAGAAQVASNVRVTSGSLRALNTPSKISANIVSSAVSLYALGPPGGTVLLSWATDTDVARSPVSDSEYRVYYTNGTAPKKTTLALASTGGGPYPTTEYNMGIPVPTTAPTLAATTGSMATGTWVYVYTYLTKFGSVVEESAPSPSATITLASTGGVTVTIPDPATTTGYNYVGKRLYRSQGNTLTLVRADVTVSGAQVTVGIGTTSFTDNYAATAIAGDPLQTTGWLPPPSGLKGIVSLPSGTMAGFRDNEIWFCEPGYPHAWPIKYMQALDSQIVAIKAFGNNIAVGTQAHPYVGSGLHPESFTFTKIARLEPCVSKRSMASDEYGAVYASRNGLVSIGLDGDNLATSDTLTRIEMAGYAPESIMGAVFENRYYGFYNNGSVAGSLVVGRGENIGIKTVQIPASAATIEPLSGQMIYVDARDNGVYSLDPVGTVPMTYIWKSKRFNTPSPVNFSAFQVLTREDTNADIAYAASVATSNAAILAANTTTFASGALTSELNSHELNGMDLNGSVLQTPIASVASTVTVYIYAGSVLRFAKDVLPNVVYRLPSGYKALGWEYQITGQREVGGFEMATTVEELKAS